MSNKIKRSYRQGIVNTDSHEVLMKGQLVEIIYEDGDYYVIQSLRTSSMERIEKKDLIVN